MGVPVVTLHGDRHVSRVGYSLMDAVNMPHMIARSPEEYVTCAMRAAANLLPRDKLREHIRRSPLMDASRFARNAETVYREMLAHARG